MANDRTLRAPRQFETVHQLSVVVARGPDAGKKVDGAPEASCQVGTSDDNDLVLADAKVSRYHLELAPAEEGIAVRDLGSSNGTYVGSTRVRDVVVAKGAQLRVGDTVLVVDAVKAPRQNEERPVIPGLLYVSQKMRDVARAALRVAPLESTVLVQGETGTGKELVASGIHHLSPRKKGPFVILDCGALTSTLVASELFGHERGAFTGAERRVLGAFERAEGGTIFLDEIGELPLSIQPSLLGVLQRRKIRRVGGEKDIPVDVRVVTATHRDLRGDVNRGTFREDLYYRIAGARIVVPPLRDRPDDIPVLARHFAEEITGSSDEPLGWTEALGSFALHSWPGNVRELRSAVERLLSLGTMTDELPTTDAEPTASGQAAVLLRYREARAAALSTFEASYLSALMGSVEGNASEAARRAGMDRPYLLSLLKRHGLR